MDRRAAMQFTVLVPLGGAIAACAPVQNAVTALGRPATAAQVTKAAAYIQTGVTALSTILTIFGPMIPPPYGAEAQVAMGVLTAATGAFGSSLAGGADASTAAASVKNIKMLFDGVTGAILSGMQAVPNPKPELKTAISTVQSVQTWTPTISALVGELFGAPVLPTKPAARLSSLGHTITPNMLGVMVP